MFIATHLVAGLVIGKISNNYPIALIGSSFVDLDHLIPLVQNGVIFNPGKLWKSFMSSEDVVDFQRNYFHSFFPLLALIIFFFGYNQSTGFVLPIAYFSHIVMDLIDSSQTYPLFPLKFRVKGIIKYLSLSEGLICACLLLVLFFL